jgi:hypothetical protein
VTGYFLWVCTLCSAVSRSVPFCCCKIQPGCNRPYVVLCGLEGLLFHPDMMLGPCITVDTTLTPLLAALHFANQQYNHLSTLQAKSGEDIVMKETCAIHVCELPC